MVKWYRLLPLVCSLLLLTGSVATAQSAGSIRGTIYDKDFDAPLPAAQVSIAETGEKITGSDDGNYVFPQVPPGVYTLVFSKDGYARQVRTEVVVTAGQLTEIDVWLSGEFTEMEEFIVQDILLGAGTEMALFLITCVCDEGVYEHSFRVVEAPSRLTVAEGILCYLRNEPIVGPTVIPPTPIPTP